MRKALIHGIVLVTATAAVMLSSVRPALPSEASPETAFQQNWFGPPSMPDLFEDDDPPGEGRPGLLDEPLPLSTGRRWIEAPPTAFEEESKFPKFMSVVDLDEWRRQDELKQLRELGGDLTFGLPLLVPQILLEELIPHGVAVGPTTFLYRTSKDSRSLPLVVFDQAIFHHAQFLAQAQAAGGSAESFSRIEKSVLRRSLMGGFRASYGLPSMSLDLILETAAEQGLWGYLLVPTAGGALLFLKGIDQKFKIDDVVKGRVQITSGREWVRAIHAPDGVPAVSCELKFFNLPFAVIVSMEMSSRGMSPQFVGIGTSLDVVEDLLGREETRGRRPGE